MVIRESIAIRAPIIKVWKVFTDLTCWADWNTVLKDVRAESPAITRGSQFQCCIRPFALPLYFEPKVEEVVPFERVCWTGEKFGISSIHEFLFQTHGDTVTVVSEEVFSGLPVTVAGRLFPKWKLVALTREFLEDLRKAAESES